MINVMVNGLPGNMASEAARHIDSDDDFNLLELEENDWVPGDVTYGLTCKSTLKKIE